MQPIVVRREDSTKKKVPRDKTLSALATEDGLPDWKAIALFNWGTVEPAEVSRLLFEYIGWEEPNADPGKIVLKPHANADREILLPKPWKVGGTLAPDKTHTIKARKPPDPPVAIRIDTLSRWFIPGKESCDLTYSLEGLAKNAPKVDLEVFGSNYCAAGDWNNGFVKFDAADLKDTKLYEKAEKTAAPERGTGLAIAEWKGQVTASNGALGKKNPGNKDRVINVAFSPYTTVLRYYKDNGDKAARLELDAFWPQFDDAGAAVANSLKIRFAVRGSDRIASTNGGGTLLVLDGSGDIVYREPVSLANLGKKDSGFNEVAWNGNYSPNTKNNTAGGAKAIKADMPYRVQVQVHTGPDQANGLALAAMSTEVRLYVHPNTHPLTLDPYVAGTDKPSLAFQSDRSLLALNEKIARKDGALWIRHQLARAGFHPGPVENPVADAYSAALNEFKRSVPKRKAKDSDPFTRFKIDASEGDDVKDAIEDMAAQAVRQRPWFGDPDANRANFDFDADSLTTRLNKPAKDLIVWVDDRHYYTDAAWLNGSGVKGTATRTKIVNAPEAMGNYALTWPAGDAMVDGKAKWIPRPWIPLSVSLILLGKSQGLNDEIDAVSEEDRKLMAKAIGPLRVDWSFDELDAAPPVEGIVDTAMYSNQVGRPKLYVKTVRDAKKSAVHARKDVKKNATYTNAPADCGGIRPAANADYHKVMYAQADESLRPWRAEPDAAFETIATIVHDNTGQADDKIFPNRFGMAGVYFRPSTIGGDGMRLRAQVRFKPAGDYKLANLAVLEKRYPLLAQAQSAAMRVWRKASIRGFVQWGPNNSWGAHNTGLRDHFKAAYLHFVFENDDNAVADGINGYFKDDDAFRDLVRESIDTTGSASKADKQRKKSGNIALHHQRLWPWYDAAHFGVFDPSGPNSTKAAAVQKFYDVFCDYYYSLSNLYGLELVKAIERRTGKLRGHIVVEFQAGDPFFVQQYECKSCGVKFFYVERNSSGDSMLNEWCPAGCLAGLKRCAPVMTGHYTCTNGHTGAWEENTAAGGAFQGSNCITQGCAGPGTLNADQEYRIKYVCNKCGWSFDFADPTGTTYVGTPCFSGTCTGKLHRPGGDAGLFTEVYDCTKCSGSATMNETSNAGGSHAGEKHAGCSKLIAGVLKRKTPNVVTAIAKGNRVEISRTLKSGYDGIPVPSIGNPVGVSWNSRADAALWAHELAHNRYLEHAANAGGNDAQHDHANNTVFNFAAINETVAKSKMWDRACLMSYVHHLPTYDLVRDKRFMCGKCILKTRGWKLASLADPNGGSHE